MALVSPNHIPVLLEKVIELLDLQSGDVVVDGTVGLGGHTTHLADGVGDNGLVIGFDLDNANLQQAQRRLSKHEGRVIFVNDSYHTIDHYIKALKLPPYNKLLLDLGLSSPHLDDPQRGFAHKESGPLDMRFNKRNNLTADRILHQATQGQLEDILRNFGEVANFRKISKQIVAERLKGRFTSTVDFAERIEPALPKRNLVKVLSQIFQALRIAVNDELNVLQEGLARHWENIQVGGIVAVISYHSLEDRIVKRFFAPKLKSCICPKSMLKCECPGEPEAEALMRKVIVPMKLEIDENPRARSAKLRVYRKNY